LINDKHIEMTTVRITRLLIKNLFYRFYSYLCICIMYNEWLRKQTRLMTNMMLSISAVHELKTIHVDSWQTNQCPSVTESYSCTDLTYRRIFIIFKCKFFFLILLKAIFAIYRWYLLTNFLINHIFAYNE
jgi:hypothetical protein